MDKVSKRSDKIAFFGLTNNPSEYDRMRGFTEFTVNKNPVEYTRKYIDEQDERNDIVSYAPSINYSFDKFSGDIVHTELVSIADNEKVGADAVRQIVIVDLSGNGDLKNATLREWTVVPDSEGKDVDTYTYSGTLKANGKLITGKAISENGWKSCAFIRDDE